MSWWVRLCKENNNREIHWSRIAAERTREPDDWPPQSKKRRVVIEEADIIRERTTEKDTRSVIKLYPIEQDFNSELQKLTEWFKTVDEGEDFVQDKEAQLLPSSLAAKASKTMSCRANKVKNQTRNNTARMNIRRSKRISHNIKPAPPAQTAKQDTTNNKGNKAH